MRTLGTRNADSVRTVWEATGGSPSTGEGSARTSACLQVWGRELERAPCVWRCREKSYHGKSWRTCQSVDILSCQHWEAVCGFLTGERYDRSKMVTFLCLDSYSAPEIFHILQMVSPNAGNWNPPAALKAACPRMVVHINVPSSYYEAASHSCNCEQPFFFTIKSETLSK